VEGGGELCLAFVTTTFWGIGVFDTWQNSGVGTHTEYKIEASRLPKESMRLNDLLLFVESAIMLQSRLANLVSVANIVYIMSAGIMVLAADQRVHGSGLSSETCDRRDVSSAIFDRLYFESEPVSIFPCT